MSYRLKIRLRDQGTHPPTEDWEIFSINGEFQIEPIGFDWWLRRHAPDGLADLEVTVTEPTNHKPQI